MATREQSFKFETASNIAFPFTLLKFQKLNKRNIMSFQFESMR